MEEVTRRRLLASAVVAGATATAATAAATPAAAEHGRDDDYPACDWTREELADRRRVMAAGLTEDEADCWLLIVRAGAKFFSLPHLHPAVNPEVAQAIHVMQDKLLMRPTYRRYLAGVPDEVSSTYQ